LILDRYTFGDAERVSQEAPVIVLRADHCEERLGGAANVSHMLRTLQTSVVCAGLVGDDPAAVAIREQLCSRGVNCKLVLTDAERPTTLKERFVGRAGTRHPNQILRVDTESERAPGGALETALVEGLVKAVAVCDAVLISDYAKGVVTPGLVRAVVAAARSAGVPVLVDPGRDRDVADYRGATLLKPNRLEAAWATGVRIDQAADALRAGRQLCRQLDLEFAVITLDRDGMALVRRDGSGEVFPTEARLVYDITGAGDMALAVMGLCLAAGQPAEIAVRLANVAAGLEVQHTGVAVFSREEIARALRGLDPEPQKHVTIDRAADLANLYRQAGRRIVLTNGCFDLLHVGHVTYLQEAASLGDVLVVAVNSDASIRRLKGSGRPIIGQQDRAAMLAALACVTHVVVFDDDTPHALLHAVRPDVLVKGGTYAPDQVIGHEIVLGYGGEVRVTSMVEGKCRDHRNPACCGGSGGAPVPSADAARPQSC
jgi:D-beta-D-heptose 7-phosphate kinase/D-beta-D-heptose 1-phosphate adenosyltransferase